MTRTILAVILWVSFAVPAGAEVIFSNLGLGDTYAVSSEWMFGGSESFLNNDTDLGSPFTPPSDFVFISIEVALTWVEGTNAADIWLMSDVNGSPGELIESFYFTNLPPVGSTGSALATGVSTLHPLLLEGNQYWVIASASGDAFMAFQFNTTADEGFSSREDGGPWTSRSTFDASAFRVNGTPAVTAVPEPTSFLFLGTGSVALITKRLRRR